MLTAIVVGISDFLPLWLLQSYNSQVEPQNILANCHILHVENPIPKEVKLLGHGHTVRERVFRFTELQFEVN